MITFKEAKAIYEIQYPDYAISSVLDVGDEFVISARDKESGEELDISPIAINKESGSMRMFFPPMNMDKLRNAVPVDIE
ncbi:MAG: hypothetical protein NC452_07185 [Eubacterium sp.]|nr:hypothetical protein [Eubacterium sp.]